MENASRTDTLTSKEMLENMYEGRSIWKNIKKMRIGWFGHVGILDGLSKFIVDKL